MAANVTPQRRNFELALVDIRRCLVDPPMADRADTLLRASWGVDRFVASLVSDPEPTRALIDTVRAVRDSPGRGSTVAEARLMQSLCSTAFACIGGLTKKSRAPDADLRRDVFLAFRV